MLAFVSTHLICINTIDKKTQIVLSKLLIIIWPHAGGIPHPHIEY